MFAKVSGSKKEDKPLRYVNERFEYFHHYWTLLFLTKIKGKSTSSQILLKPNYLFIEEDRLESHRSLFVKVNKQLHYNYYRSKKNLDYLFVDHSYFSDDNIIIRKYAGLANKIRDARQAVFNANKNFENHSSSVKSGICSAFQDVESQLFRRYPYERRLATQLHKVLSINKPLDDQAKADIKFLVNAFVIELYRYGYSEDYIGRVPDTISFRDGGKDFPYEKTILDFKSKGEYQQYVKEENKKMNLGAMLDGLVKLINNRKYKGYTIFKVNGVTLDKNRKLLGVEFYNPQTERKAKNRYKHSIDPELFVKDSSDSSSAVAEPSTCNAIVDTEFLSPYDINGPQVLRAAYRKAETAALLLDSILNKYADTPRKISITLQHDRCLSMFDSNKIPSFKSEIFKPLNISSTIKFLDDKTEKWAEDELAFHNTQIDNRILALIHQQRISENISIEFNFKDLWTAWEGLFEDGNKKEELKRVCKYAVRIYLSTNFLPKVKRILYGSLYADEFKKFFITTSKFYLLEEGDIQLLGLHVPEVGMITVKDFKRKYKDILSTINFPLLQEIVNRVDTFVKTPKDYYQDVDKWLDRTIDEVYAERNLEAHNNEETDLSRFKLQAPFLDVSAITVNELIRNTNAKNRNDIRKILKKLENKASKI